MAKKKPSQKHDDPVVATNRKAPHDYTIIEAMEAGVALMGTEVKSCREHHVQLQDGYVRIAGGEAWMCNVHIAPYGYGGHFNHEEKRERRLLLHARQILKLSSTLKSKGGTIIPLKMYLKNGLVKVEIAYCQGKTHGDKREAIRKREVEMEMRRARK
ncbi:MAG: SsrA-binding protein SmpB [Victivallaceae bacterium]|nr:SsrA-binding protein SmpB [Victivallaceae bacterium]